MAGEFSYKVGVFDLFVEGSDECSAGHVGAGDICYRLLFCLSCFGVDDRDHSCYSGFPEYFLYCVVVFLLAYQWEDVCCFRVIVFVYDFSCDFAEIDFYDSGVFTFGFAGDV